jgi:hypothetical protein
MKRYSPHYWTNASCSCEASQEDLWEADDHITAASATTMRFEFEVPCAITEQLRSSNLRSSQGAKFVEPGMLDQQTLRSVRRISWPPGRQYFGKVCTDSLALAFGGAL